MRRFSQLIVMLTALQSAWVSISVSASAIEDAEQWLSEYVSLDDTFSIALSKNKIRFKGCKQKQYQLVVNQQFTKRFNVEAIVHYNKGLLDYGVLAQRVKSHEFEVVSWWDKGSYRVGLSHKIRPEHEISIPVAEVIQLPTSTTASVYFEVPLMEERHTLTVAASRESWKSDSATIQLPWSKAHDNQVKLQYAIAF
ncbi:hypothetical protein C7Y69_12890 [Alteromonas sp. KS69]|jgi:hypothetical protein|uniref:DUF4390 domain-containing protein n=1 Tax=Alteromonas naphthalenivorans TaxID=715451 RepID=F5ZF21_ALTNA|nr:MULTISPECIES: hypothetical protein [Alteromonas]MBB67100.1 hypothetical protein [Rickettsiales bacterium]PHS59733.1 MAG: hypothetical protein COB03_01740 [Alteromonas sp.]AEF04798.1 hypothetical protein ambt_16465 [Alteromonas naphthalenivorans]MBO7923867.1 hypothetical protein [Alteromonas sp. K632G]RUP79672.1 hypothetical protein C7Y69_12890 [Alteromonas sp. KS69]